MSGCLTGGESPEGRVSFANPVAPALSLRVYPPNLTAPNDFP
jgi:hypothetical protein